MEVVSLTYDKGMEVKKFDETKTGVKGLVDSGITKIPRFFIHKPEPFNKSPSYKAASLGLRIPAIDFTRVNDGIRRKEIVNELREASETWGFFQMVNHGIPVDLMDEMLGAVRGFHEQPKEMKMSLYSRDTKRKVRYLTNGDLLVRKASADWRDTLVLDFPDNSFDAAIIPQICRESVSKYLRHMQEMIKTLRGLLSEALGLPSDYLACMECMEAETLTCHYYPPCPQPELAMNASTHTDPFFLTILLQDSIGGLQVLRHGNWVDVPPMRGALIVNIGDFLQIISNEKFKSVEHRVLAARTGPRVSTVCFVYPREENMVKPYGPIEEIVCAKSPIYKQVHVREYMAQRMSMGQSGDCLSHFKLMDV